MSQNSPILVIGPTIVDTMYSVRPNGLDQTASIPRFKLITEPISTLGGAAYAAVCVNAMGFPTMFVSLQGISENVPKFSHGNGEEFRDYTAHVPGYACSIKNRLYDQDRLVARFDNDPSYNECQTQVVIRLFRQAVSDRVPAGILVSDYGKGVCTPQVLDHVLSYGKSNKIPVIVDPYPTRNRYCYRGATGLVPNESEVLALHGGNVHKFAAQDLRSSLHLEFLLMTKGNKGAFIVGRHGETWMERAYSAIARDTCGAGDAVAAATICSYVNGVDLRSVMSHALAAGAAAVEYQGCIPISYCDVFKKLIEHSQQRKLVTMDRLLRLRNGARVTHNSVGVANGVFDLMHAGHMAMLQFASTCSSFLIVLVNSDKSLAALKRRAVNTESERVAALMRLPYVHAVATFDGPTPIPELDQLRPGKIFKGPDYVKEQVVGKEIVENSGGQVIITPQECSLHTSLIINRIKAGLNEQASFER